MKLIEKKLAPSNKSFSIYRNTTPCLDESWHYHHELELVYVLKGTGIRFIGDDVREFEEGQLALIGANLPHLLKNSPEYYHNNGLETDVIVLQFDRGFLGEHFFDLFEMVLINRMIDQAQLGLDFSASSTKLKVKEKLLELLHLAGFESIHCLLGILNMLASSDQSLQIASAGFSPTFNDKDSSRLDLIYQHVMNNYHREIELSEVAEIAHLGVSPFCRFFKKRTHKSFSQFLNEVRVGHACKLLVDNNMSVSQIAFSCGYNSQTNFNRHFKNIRGLSPKAYQRMYLKK